MANQPTLTAVVLARDEATMIEACLRRLSFADTILVGIDTRTVDDTEVRALQHGAQVTPVTPSDFADMRNQLLAQVTSDWVLFVDADERVPSALRAEIEQRITEPPAAYRVGIANWFYGHRVRRSGYRERPLRLFPSDGVRFVGEIHEEPRLPPALPVRMLGHELVHLSHRSISANLIKTSRYAEVQARELLANGHPRVTRWTLLLVLLKRLGQHLVVGQGFRDGTAGFVESIYQPLSHFCVYARLWELQQSPSIDERYQQLEAELT